jgi:hypothetical protein
MDSEGMVSMVTYFAFFLVSCWFSHSVIKYSILQWSDFHPAQCSGISSVFGCYCTCEYSNW